MNEAESLREKLRGILREYWGYEDFRGIQWEIIESIYNRRDTLGLMPTGGGKSITFQVPALAMDGVCVIITPLIALMKDQVAHLKEHNLRAAAIYSGMSRREIISTIENAIFGGYDFLYISPERLGSELFRKKFKRVKVSFITVDEAHCISQWGYDFRPSYLHIAEIRKDKPEVPVLALTATATPEVVDDIQDKLLFSSRNVFKMSFERKNLAYVVRNAMDKRQEMIHILKSVKGSAIVYVRSRKRSKEISKLLSDSGIEATFYHAGLEPSVKDERQRQWQHDETRVMVATNAFGMGIDKPDVRTVIHYDCPNSLEEYFQEAGRAGRDGNRAWAVLLFNNNDITKLNRRVTDTFPEKDFCRDVYEHLAYFYQIGVGSGRDHTFELPIDKFCYTYRYYPTLVSSALNILQQSGYISYEPNPDGKARLRFILNRNQLYRLDGLPAQEDTVITSLLRLYGGLFNDYCYIDLSAVATVSGLDENMVYMVLRTLTRQRILDFIPQRKIPYITYLRDRVDAGNVVIPKEAYEDRKDQFCRRIQSMEEYAKNDSVCRSRQLLAYFGETADNDCGHCDVCVNRKKEDRGTVSKAQQTIMQILADGKKHYLRELKDIIMPAREFDSALSFLVNEEKVVSDGVFIAKT